MHKKEIIDLLNYVGKRAFGRSGSGYLPYTLHDEWKELKYSEFVAELLATFHDAPYNICPDADSNSKGYDALETSEIAEGLNGGLSTLLGVQSLAHGVNLKTGAFMLLNRIDEVTEGSVLAGHTDDPERTIWVITEIDMTLEQAINKALNR